MFKRNGFTLIELIVVIAVLGILAAIVVPNISNFQNQARDVQLTADTRNVQTALDMYRIASADGISEPLAEDPGFEANYELDSNGEVVEIADVVGHDGTDDIVSNVRFFETLDLEGLYPTHLRQAPGYAVESVNETDWNTGDVVFAVLQKTLVGDFIAGEGEEDDTYEVEAGSSTAIVHAISSENYVDGEFTDDAEKIIVVR